MITYLLLPKNSIKCYALLIKWRNGKTRCQIGVNNIGEQITMNEVIANNSAVSESVEGTLCPISVVGSTVYFGGHAYFIRDGIVYRDNESLNVPWNDLGDMLDNWMKKRPFTITPSGEWFRLDTPNVSEVREAKKVCIRGRFYETIDFSNSPICYDKPTTFPIPENDGRFVPYCHNRNELLRVLRQLNRYEDVDKQDYQQLENGNWTITDRVLSRLYERVIGSPKVKDVRDIKKIIKFLDNV